MTPAEYDSLKHPHSAVYFVFAMVIAVILAFILGYFGGPEKGSQLKSGTRDSTFVVYVPPPPEGKLFAITRSKEVFSISSKLEDGCYKINVGGAASFSLEGSGKTRGPLSFLICEVPDESSH